MNRLMIFIFFLSILSCKGKKASEADEASTDAQTPVTVTTTSREPMVEYVDLNATATFLQKNYVKANINGYVEQVRTQIGKYVKEGDVLFVLKTKEAQAIGNAVNKLDPNFRFSGINNIKSTGHGFINQLSHQPGDYVQDGEQLAVINDLNSFAFVMDVPFEFRQYILSQKDVTIILPDSTKLTGYINATMPTVDPAAQTQSVIVKIRTTQTIPENLIAKIRIIKSEHSDAILLPKAAVLANETQSEFWVMKMIDSVTAVKTTIKKGMEANGKVEILAPVFSDADKILLTGNFGLPDTAKVKIVQQQ